VFVVPGQGLGPGQAFQGERESAGVAELAGGGVAVEVEGPGGFCAAALFGDEAQLGQDNGVGGAGFEAGLVDLLEHPAQVPFGRVEVAFPACGFAEPDLGEVGSGLVAVVSGEPHRPLVKGAGLRVVAGQRLDPAEPGQLIGGLGPEPEFFGHAQASPVQARGVVVVTGGLRLRPPG
jgi:hypothetical protein